MAATKEADKTGTKPPASPDPVGDAALEALLPFIHVKSPGAKQVARMAGGFASRGEDNGFAINRAALLYAMIEHGSSAENKASSWLFSWLRESKPAMLAAFQEFKDEVSETVSRTSGNIKFRVSLALTKHVLPDALSLAQATVGRDKADLRHLVIAMLDNPGHEWRNARQYWDMRQREDGPGDGDFDMTPADFQILKTHIAERVLENPERGESSDAWRKIIANPAVKAASLFGDNANDLTGFQTDDPALVDALDREGFADALVQLILQAHARNKDGERQLSELPDRNHAFVIHLDGPWGTGKSSVLNFLRAKLKGQVPSWLVVDFNAWKLQRLEPPWWTVITQIQTAAEAQAETLWHQDKLWFVGQFSRLRFFGLPVLVGLTLLAAAIWFGVWEVAETHEAGWKTIGAIMTGIGGLYAFSRTLIFGQSKSLQTYESLQPDPYGPIMAHFELLVRSIARPVIVMIDDLDRCDITYVTALIESIQTMLRGTPITYLVAADRRWICTSFEKRYKDFEGHAPDAGRPLGYLFLEKIFQVSTSLPTISPEMQSAYWSGLIAPPTASSDNQAAEQAAADKVVLDEALNRVRNQRSHAGLHAAIANETNREIKRAMTRAAAEQLASPIVQSDTEHSLRAFPSLMERNPRAMKRLVSAVTMNGARLFTEGRSVELVSIARWTALELRWPLLAERLAQYPDLLSESADPKTPADPVLDALLATSTVQDVIGGGNTSRLTREVLVKLVG